MTDLYIPPENRDAYYEAMELSSTLLTVSGASIVIGLGASLVASAILLKNGRAHLAILSCLLLVFTVGNFGAGVSTALLFFLMLVSLVNWPTTHRWVNWPLVLGGGVGSLCLALSALVVPAGAYY